MIDTKRPLVLAIAGSDSSGGAGVQIDTKTAYSLGAEVATVITALTAQNPEQLRSVELVSEQMIEAQFRAVADWCEVSAVKIGMVATPECVKLIARLIREYKLRNVVVDPVLAATSGGELARSGVAAAIIEHLVPLATVLTPNQDEAEVLCGLSKAEIASAESAQACWQSFEAIGLQALLLKGGHAGAWQAKGEIVDMLYERGSSSVQEFRAPRLRVPEINTHGTGCTLSTAVASHLALGYSLPQATGRAIDYVQSLLRESCSETE